MYWQKLGSALNLLADLLTFTQSAVRKAAGRFWLRVVNLLARLSDSLIILPVRNMLAEVGGGGKSARRFSDCHQIFQTGKSAGRNGEGIYGRFSDCHEICQSGNLLADMGEG